MKKLLQVLLIVLVCLWGIDSVWAKGGKGKGGGGGGKGGRGREVSQSEQESEDDAGMMSCQSLKMR